MATDEAPTVDPAEVSAGPTKAFFVSMITRDIELIPAIVDLVDNSVDGARSLRGSNGQLNGLVVQIECTPDRFRIVDNCGGIPIDVARKYAFRFGRPADAPGVPHSVGQFGVGMKRALFKLGKAFDIKSTAAESTFRLSVDVAEWSEANSWTFDLSEFAEGQQYRDAERGTTITVSPLHREVSDDFSLGPFATALYQDVASKHQLSIIAGLEISINGTKIEAKPLTLLASDEISPAFRRTELNGSRPAPVEVRLFAGVAESDPSEAGWYIYCNGRLVLGPDQTKTTVWGEGRGRTIPRFHTQFARFRGFAFFDSDQPHQLPWTTTKVGVDGNSSIWRSSRREMVTMTRPVINFLNAIDWERPLTGENDEIGRLEQLVLDAEPKQLFELSEIAGFTSPARSTLAGPPSTSSIQYRQPNDLIDTAKEVLGVSTNREVGELTFLYFLDAERPA